MKRASVRSSIVWFTGQLAPYRLPAWETLAQDTELTVALTGSDHANRPTWSIPNGTSYKIARFRPAFASSNSDSARTGFVNPLSIQRLLAVAQPDAVVVQAWGDLGGLQASFIARALGIPQIGYYGTTAASRTTQPLIAYLRDRHLRSLDALVTYGSETTRLATAGGVSEQAVVTGFNTVDVRTSHDSANALRRSSDTHTQTHRFLFVGQLIERKAPDLVVRALSKPDLSSAHLSIAGDGPMRRRLERLIADLGLSDRVSLVGMLSSDEIAHAYANAHTLVMPSRQEIWGLVVNEALASGLHAVVSANAGCAEDVAGHRGVFLCSPTEESVAAAMHRSKRSWNGWLTAPEMLSFGPDRLARDILQAFELAVAKSRHGL